MMRQSLAALTLAALLAIPGTKALAAPSNAPTSSTFPVQCGGQSYVVTVNSGQSGGHGQGKASPNDAAFIVSGGSGVALPLAFSGTFVDMNGIVLGSFSSTKGNAQATGLPQQTCTFQQTDQFSNTFYGTVTVALNAHANTAH